MATHKHRFQRLNDTALFCECGEVRHVAEQLCTRPHYPTWVWPVPYTVPYTVPYYPWWLSQTTSVSGSVTTSGTVTYPSNDDNFTYTLTSGSAT